MYPSRAAAAGDRWGCASQVVRVCGGRPKLTTSFRSSIIPEIAIDKLAIDQFYRSMLK